MYFYSTMNQEIFCLSKRSSIVFPPLLWPFPSCSSAYVRVPLDIYSDTLPFAALVTYLLTKNSVFRMAVSYQFHFAENRSCPEEGLKNSLWKKNAVDNGTVSLYFMSQFFHPTTSPGPIDMHRKKFDYLKYSWSYSYSYLSGEWRPRRIHRLGMVPLRCIDQGWFRKKLVGVKYTGEMRLFAPLPWNMNRIKQFCIKSHVIYIKGTVAWDFFISVFFINQHLIGPWWSLRNSFIFFREFTEIFVHEVWLSAYYLRKVKLLFSVSPCFLIFSFISRIVIFPHGWLLV